MKEDALWVWNALKAAWPIAWDAIKIGLGASWGAIKVAWHFVFDPLKEDALWVWNALKAAWPIAWDAIKIGLGASWGAIKVAWHFVFDPLKAAVLVIWDGVETAWDIAWGGIKGVIKGAVNVIIGWINALILAWNSLSFSVPSFSIPGVSVPGWVPGIGGKGWSGYSFGGNTFSTPKISEIPALAKGGIVTGPTLARIGEEGPEAVVPLDRAGGLGRGLTVNVYMDGATVLGGDLEDTIVEVVDRAVRRGVQLGVT